MTSVKTVWTVWHQCGHPQDHDFGRGGENVPPDKRASKAAWWRGRDCVTCWRGRPDSSGTPTAPGVALSATPASSARGPATATAGRNEWIQRRPLPALQGTPTQCDYADDVRSRLLTSAWEALALEGVEPNEFLIGIETSARQVPHAKWWIEHKDVSPGQLAKELESAVKSEREVRNVTHH